MAKKKKVSRFRRFCRRVDRTISFLLITAIVLATPCAFAFWFVPISGDRVKFIAHRGLSSAFYENTVQAFAAAGQSNFFYAIETDVRVTADGYFVLAHCDDQFQDQTKLVSEITLEEARLLPLRNPDYRLATFEEFLDICVQYNKVAVIEIKPTLDKETLERLVEIVIEQEWFFKSRFISFDKQNLVYIREMYPDANLQFLTANTSDIDFNFNLGVQFGSLGFRNIREAQRKNLEVNVWTVNYRGIARWFIWLGVDYVTTDYELDSRMARPEFPKIQLFTKEQFLDFWADVSKWLSSLAR